MSQTVSHYQAGVMGIIEDSPAETCHVVAFCRAKVLAGGRFAIGYNGTTNKKEYNRKNLVVLYPTRISCLFLNQLNRSWIGFSCLMGMSKPYTFIRGFRRTGSTARFSCPMNSWPYLDDIGNPMQMARMILWLCNFWGVLGNSNSRRGHPSRQKYPSWLILLRLKIWGFSHGTRSTRSLK